MASPHFVTGLTLLVLLGAWTGTSSLGWAKPYVPDDDHEVIETLRTKPLDATVQELKRLRRIVAEQPDNVDAALRLATRYIEQSRHEADPRYVGYAQAILAPWLKQEPPRPHVLLLRATMRQSLHDFDGALHDLEYVLRRNPQNPQAWLTSALILQVQGRYDEARRHCAPLIRLTGMVTSAACLAAVGSLDGQASASYELLASAFARADAVSAAERQWMATLLAEIAERRGQSALAEAHYRAALAAGPHDPYLLAAYADFLLDRGRLEEVVALLKTERKADALLLRLVLAESQLGLPEAELDRDALAARFEAGRRRGDRMHRREEARFRLAVLGETQEALRLAEENWAVQREPADARVLLEAAVAAGRPRAARAVVEWFTSRHVEDVRLAPLVQRVEGPRS